MIAKINCNGVVATLEDTGRWSSPNRKLADVLNKIYGQNLYPFSPSNDGLRQALAAADGLGAEVAWMPDYSPEHLGRVY